MHVTHVTKIQRPHSFSNGTEVMSSTRSSHDSHVTELRTPKAKFYGPRLAENLYLADNIVTTALVFSLV